MDISTQTVDLEDVSLFVATSGSKDKPLLILLHGFPEYWAGWKAQMEILSKDYFIIAPNQRGYSGSSRPWRVKNYMISKLSKDIVDLASYFGFETFFLAGHDWGAAVAWHTALTYPDLIEKLVIVNVPHPAIMNRFVRRNFRQLRKSWYILFFQLPLIPVVSLRAFNFKMLQYSVVSSSKRGTFTQDSVGGLKESWKTGSVRTMINWYRAALRFPPNYADLRLKMPVLILWGAKDAFLMKEMADLSMKYIENGKLEVLDDATHWVLHERPEETSKLMKEFLD